jgi:hypothetical protein
VVWSKNQRTNGEEYKLPPNYVVAYSLTCHTLSHPLPLVGRQPKSFSLLDAATEGILYPLKEDTPSGTLLPRGTVKKDTHAQNWRELLWTDVSTCFDGRLSDVLYLPNLIFDMKPHTTSLSPPHFTLQFIHNSSQRT